VKALRKWRKKIPNLFPKESIEEVKAEVPKITEEPKVRRPKVKEEPQS